MLLVVLGLWRVGQICPQQLAAGGGCVDGGLGLEQALWCDAPFFATPPFPSRPCLLLWAGRQPCDGEERRIWLLSGDVWGRHMGSGGPGGICGGAHASGSGASQRLLPGLVDGRCSAWCCRCSAGTVGPAGGGGGPRCFATVVATGASLGPLDGFVWIGWAAAAVEVCFVPGSWPDVVLGVFLGESLSDGDAPGRRFPC
jgi:hypothetical protein